MEIIKTIGHISNDNGNFDVCLVDDHLSSLWLATYDPATDEVDCLRTVNDLEDAMQKASEEFKTQPEFSLTATTDINASEETIMNDEILFTPAALLDFLSQIDELSDKDISLDETGSAIRVSIGDSTYSLDIEDAHDVEVPEDVVEEVDDINEIAYANIENVDYSEATDEEVVEGGILSEALKTLAVGGMVRLTGKLLGKDVADSILKK